MPPLKLGRVHRVSRKVDSVVVVDFAVGFVAVVVVAVGRIVAVLADQLQRDVQGDTQVISVAVAVAAAAAVVVGCSMTVAVVAV